MPRSPRRSCGRVYLFRGALGPIFSREMDRLTKRLEEAGIRADVYEFTLCRLIAFRDDAAPITSPTVRGHRCSDALVKAYLALTKGLISHKIPASTARRGGRLELQVLPSKRHSLALRDIAKLSCDLLVGPGDLTGVSERCRNKFGPSRDKGRDRYSRLNQALSVPLPMVSARASAPCETRSPLARAFLSSRSLIADHHLMLD